MPKKNLKSGVGVRRAAGLECASLLRTNALMAHTQLSRVPHPDKIKTHEHPHSSVLLPESRIAKNAVVPGVLNSHYMTYSARELKKQLIRYQLLAPSAARKSRPDAACLLLGRYRRKLRWPLSRQLCGQICGWSHSRSSSDANFGAGRSTCRSTHLELVEVLPKRRNLL